MSETKFTRGPWNYEYTGDGKRIRVGLGLFDGPNGYDIAEVYSDDVTEETKPEAEANAHLIAAAPELYEALKSCLNFMENTESEIGFSLESADQARDALAKARGETPRLKLARMIGKAGKK